MRPIRRDSYSTQYTDYAKYKDELCKRLGTYCSYCEDQITVGLAVEHILPRKHFPALKTKWENLLLACAKCNGKKSDNYHRANNIYLPDRDNTFTAFKYLPNGQIQPTNPNDNKAQNTIQLIGLNQQGDTKLLDRRKEAWLKAKAAKNLLLSHINTNNKDDAIRLIICISERRFFSIWLEVFKNFPDVRKALIDVYPSTRASGCFDTNANPVSPCPNYDKLPHGGKI